MGGRAQRQRGLPREQWPLAVAEAEGDTCPSLILGGIEKLREKRGAGVFQKSWKPIQTRSSLQALVVTSPTLRTAPPPLLLSSKRPRRRRRRRREKGRRISLKTTSSELILTTRCSLVS